MATEVTTSNYLSLNWRDAAKGTLVAAMTAAFATIGQAITAGALPTMQQIKVAALAGLAAGFSYLVKNFFTPSQTVITAVPAGTMPYTPPDVSTSKP